MRLARGLDELIPNALAGIRRMPRMGANPALSDRELARAAIYMMNAAGARWPEPSEASLTAWRRIADRRQP